MAFIQDNKAFLIWYLLPNFSYNLHNDKLNQIYYFWGKYLPGSPLLFGPSGGCDGLAVVGAARGKLFYTFVNVWYISTTDS